MGRERERVRWEGERCWHEQGGRGKCRLIDRDKGGKRDEGNTQWVRDT